MASTTTGAPTKAASAVAAGWLALAAGLAPAQEPAATEPVDFFAEAIEVELLDLQVVVTDEEGRRVPDLPPTAFRVLVDGEEAPIELFSEVRDAAPDAAADTTLTRPPVNYLVFIDDLMTQKSRRDVVLRRLKADLDELASDDRMAVVRLARQRKLQVLTDWTSDRETLEAAFDRAIELPAWGIKYIALKRMEAYVANWEGNDTRRSVLAAAGSLRLLDRPSGRRAMLLVAGSWDPAEVSRADWFSPWCVTGWCQGAAVYNVLTDTANLFGYTIYAIDVEGRDPDVNWGREKRLHAVLGELARVTGGRRLLNGDRLEVLSEAVADTRSYYAIGVTPPARLDGQRTRIEIEMLREGLTARSQTAFVPLTEEHDRQLDVLNALWLEDGAGDGPLALTLDNLHRLSGGKVALTAHLSVPVDRLTWQPGSRGDYADVTLEIANVDWRGDSSAVEVRHLRLRHPGSGDTLIVPWPLELRRRRHTVVVGLRDRLGGASFTAVAELSPREEPSPPGAEAIRVAAE